MKKRTLITMLALLVLGISTYSFAHWKKKTPAAQPTPCEAPEEKPEVLFPQLPMEKPMPTQEFVYNIDNRFMTSITLEQLRKAKSLPELLPSEATEGMSQYAETRIDRVPNNNRTPIKGNGEVLNASQLALLKSIDYSNDFYLEALCQIVSEEAPEPSPYHLVYYLTVVPETVCSYSKGKEALLEYLKKGSAKEVDEIDWAQLEPGRIKFTISKKGAVTKVALSSTCGDDAVDARMQELIENMPGKWKPAKDARGHAVAQELVFFYGEQGC